MTARVPDGSGDWQPPADGSYASAYLSYYITSPPPANRA